MSSEQTSILTVVDGGCAWCLTTEQRRAQLQRNPNTTHGVCKRHAEQIAQQAQARRERKKELVKA